MSELRDVRFDGQSYQALTQAALGKTFEPGTVIDPPHPRTKVAKDRQAQAVTMRVALLGVAPPSKGSCRIALDVGWDKKTEVIVLEVPVSKLVRR